MTEKYTFKIDEKVERRHVNYSNRYDITIAADLYRLKAENFGLRKPALVVGPPYGGVKEQGPGVYANELAKRGFVVLAFDPAFMGESGGTPRHTSSPDIFVENFSAGVDYLRSLPFVDPEKIGAIGLCGSGGFALAAAQADTRIKAVATASLYDISTVDRESLTARQLFELKVSLNRQRQLDFENGEPEYLPSFPETPSEAVPDG